MYCTSDSEVNVGADIICYQKGQIGSIILLSWVTRMNNKGRELRGHRSDALYNCVWPCLYVVDFNVLLILAHNNISHTKELFVNRVLTWEACVEKKGDSGNI